MFLLIVLEVVGFRPDRHDPARQFLGLGVAECQDVGSGSSGMPLLYEGHRVWLRRARLMTYPWICLMTRATSTALEAPELPIEAMNVANSGALSICT